MAVLTDDGLSLDAVAGVVVGAGHGGQLAVGRRDVAELVAKSSALVESTARSERCARCVVHRVVCKHRILAFMYMIMYNN